ncbi:MAG TPA: CBS domain-containing protein [Candidatus Nitrosotalea sp.]|nr:CBS domain-containing protein [Candidatus Nitrosotalea sp.]
MLLRESLLSSPAVSVGEDDFVREAANLLPHHLETFTDSLVVVRNEKPVGLIGGSEVLEGLMKNPTADFFDNTKIGEIMSKNLVILDEKCTLGEILDLWLKTRRAFALLPNVYHGFSAISARKILEVGMSCKSKTKLGDIPKREMLTFTKNQKIKDIIGSMQKNKTRKLVLEGTSEFISDRIIIQKIARDLNCLKNESDFLQTSAADFKLDLARRVSGDVPLEEGCKLLYGMQSPYILLPHGVVTPWDAVMALRSKDVSIPQPV